MKKRMSRREALQWIALSVAGTLASCMPDVTEPASPESEMFPTAPNTNASTPTTTAISLSPTPAIETAGSDDKKILIAFFSRADENLNVGVIDTGNTQIIAEMIAEHTGGELFHIQTAKSYPESYQDCLDVAQQEKRDDIRPELTAGIENIEAYDALFLGYPNWWGEMPMAVYTFMETYDLNGKMIMPFCTHEGSGLSNTVNRISNVYPDAEVLDGFSLRGQIAQFSREEANTAVVEWLTECGFMG